MTYTIQAVAGVAVALAAIAGVALRRTRRWFVKALGIDENAHKEKESMIMRTAPAAVAVRADDGIFVPLAKHAAVDQEAPNPSEATSNMDGGPEQPQPEAKGSKAAYAPKWWQRLLVGAIVSVFVAFTVMVVAPYEIVGGSAGSLLFSLRDVWQLFVLPAAMAAVVATLLLTVLRGRAFNAVLMVLFSFGLCCYLQVLLLNGGLPTSDGNAITWTDYAQQAGISALVWAVVLLVPWLASHLNIRVAHGAVALVSVALVVVQAVGVASLFSDDLMKVFNPEIKYTASEYTLTENEMFTVSPKSNVIVLILDAYDTANLETALEDDPYLLDNMTGFTWYKDSVGAMIPTRYGVPFLLTGQYPQKGEKFSTFLNERYERSSFLADIDEAGYSIGLYTDTLGLEYMPEDRVRALVYDRTVNIIPPTADFEVRLDEEGTYAVLMKCALYRDLPWLAKPFFWYYTDEVNNAMIGRDSMEFSTDGVPYAMDDARWYETLKNTRLSFEDDADDHAGAYRFIHLQGAHYPFSIDENGKFLGEWQSTRERQALGSMRMANEYLAQLKQLGVYDCSTIIITADHGDWYLTEHPLEEPVSPVLLVKPANAPDEPYYISSAPVSTYDVLPTVIAGIQGADAGKYGLPVYEIPEAEDRERYYYETTSKNQHDWKLLEYKIGLDVHDIRNWELTGEEWDMQK